MGPEKEKPYMNTENMERQELKQQLKQQIIKFLNLVSVTPEEIRPE